MCVVNKEKTLRHRKTQHHLIRTYGTEVLHLQEKLRTGEPVEVLKTRHSYDREDGRKISFQEILEVVSSGTIIEYQGNENKRKGVAACRHLPESDDPCINVILHKFINDRHIHVAVNVQGESILVKTAYYPEDHPWKWDETFTQRVFVQKVE